MKISLAARTYGNGFATVERREIAAQAFQAGMHHEAARAKMLARFPKESPRVEVLVREAPDERTRYE